MSLQLYRLTDTDITALQQERLELNERILMYQNILSNPEILNKVLINELKAIKKTLRHRVVVKFKLKFRVWKSTPTS